MARSINKVMIIGTLGRDPEVRYLPNGNAVCSMSLATDEGYKDKNTGQKVEKTEWHRIEAFGRLAEVMGEYLKRGSKCYVEGKLRTDEYVKDGIKRYATKIIAKEMTMLDSRPNQSGGDPSYGQQAPAQRQQQAPAQPVYGQAPQQRQNAQPTYGQQAPQQVQQAAPSNAFDDFDDDIPF